MSSLESDIKYCVSKYGARLDDYIVDTVFFGGGTPSYVSPQLIAGILKTLKSEFAFDENSEISIECNPGTIDDEFIHLKNLKMDFLRQEMQALKILTLM